MCFKCYEMHCISRVVFFWSLLGWRWHSPCGPSLSPRPLATSFEGKHGRVRYWVKAELHRPWLLPMKTKKEFTVFEHIDINTPLLLVSLWGGQSPLYPAWFFSVAYQGLSVHYWMGSLQAGPLKPRSVTRHQRQGQQFLRLHNRNSTVFIIA